MIINPEITNVLKEFKIDRDEGLLCLLGIFYNLDVEKVCSEDTIKAINLTKIVVRNFKLPGNPITWNMPLFGGQQTDWDWVVSGYNDAFGKINKDRKDNNADVIKRMQEWFKKYPQYRKDDVQKATQAYFATVKDPKFLKSSAKFIFEGLGASKVSHLLTWCEKINQAGSNLSQMKGRIV